MPDIAAARPTAGAPIESAWGGQVHDAVESIQYGTVNVSGITSSASSTVPVVFPRPYASTPVIVATCASNVVNIGMSAPSATGVSFNGRRTDGSGTATAQDVGWIAVGVLA